MNRISSTAAFAAASFAVALALLCGPFARAQAPAPPQTAEQAYRNIQVLKGLPADQLIPTMQFFEASLGVGCDFCHMPARDNDGKREKVTARSMIRMVNAINSDTFGGRRAVTCFSCHRGAERPVAMPPVVDANYKPEPPPATGKEADAVLDKYLQSLGGPAALQKVSSRVAKGAVTDAAGQKLAVELISKAPDKGSVVTHLANGSDNITTYAGNGGWVRAGAGQPRDIRGYEGDAAKIADSLYFNARLKQNLTDLRMGPAEKVDDRDASVVLGSALGHVPVRLYFDKSSGTLLRIVHFTESAMGPLPTQIDFADYRDVDGVKVPFRWTVARPEPQGRQTYQMDQVQQNTQIEDSRFARPGAPVASR